MRCSQCQQENPPQAKFCLECAQRVAEPDPGEGPCVDAAGQGRASGVVDPERDVRPVIHLDSSFLIRAMTPGSTEDGRLRRWLAAGEPIGINAVSRAEFLCGRAGAALATRNPTDFRRFESAGLTIAVD